LLDNQVCLLYDMIVTVSCQININVYFMSCSCTLFTRTHCSQFVGRKMEMHYLQEFYWPIPFRLYIYLIIILILFDRMVHIATVLEMKLMNYVTDGSDAQCNITIVDSLCESHYYCYPCIMAIDMHIRFRLLLCKIMKNCHRQSGDSKKH